MGEDRLVEQILQPGMVVAIQVAILENLFAGIAVRVQMLFKYDLALGKCAGLVGAQHVHRPKVLDRVQTFDDHFLARHRQGTFGKVDRHDHGQHLGGQSNGHRHRKQESFQPVVFAQSVDQEDRRNHHGNEIDHQPGKLVDAFIEAG